MLHCIDIKVYYAEGVSFVALGNNTFFAVSDDGQRRFIAQELPSRHSESSESSDNQGRTGGHARSIIATARQVAQAMQASESSLASM
jgi:hypothetical protein